MIEFTDDDRKKMHGEYPCRSCGKAGTVLYRVLAGDAALRFRIHCDDNCGIRTGWHRTLDAAIARFTKGVGE